MRRCYLTIHPLLLIACSLLLAACGNSYRAPPPQPPPQLTVLYGVDAHYKSLYTLDSRLGVHSVVGPPATGRLDSPDAMAIRPADGEVFVYNNGDSVGLRRQWGLVRIDRCTGFARRLGPVSLPRTAMGAMAFSPDGDLYAFGQSQTDDAGFHSLYRLTAESGDFMPIGEVANNARYSVAAADYHPDGDLYAIGTIQAEGLQLLIVIDTSTGAPSIVGEVSPGVGAITSIAFKPSGKLLGTGVNTTGGKVLFEIDIASAGVSDIRRSTVAAGGMGFAPPRSC
ncbi:MAG: hypothetical protein V2I66_04830 [Halieaceae bacterium]|jgi:hypothetical protein|nr:hypothetical protein [Halieaceae bacterium]